MLSSAFRCKPSPVLLMIPIAAWCCVASATAAPFVYVSDLQLDQVFIIDAETNQVVKTLQVSDPVSLAASPDGSRVLVANSDPREISIIDTQTQTVVETVPVGFRPGPIAFSSSGEVLYVGSIFTDEMRALDAETYEVLDSVVVAEVMSRIAVSPSGDRLYIAADGGGGLSVVDVASFSVIAHHPGLFGEFDVALTPDGGRAFVGAVDQAYAFDTETFEVTLLFDKKTFFRGVAVEPDGSRVYISRSQIPGELRVLDAVTLEILPGIPIPLGAPSRLAITADGRRLFATDLSAGAVRVIDLETQSVIATIPTGPIPHRIVIPPEQAPQAPPTPVIEIPTLGMLGLGLLVILLSIVGATRLRAG